MLGGDWSERERGRTEKVSRNEEHRGVTATNVMGK